MKKANKLTVHKLREFTAEQNNWEPGFLQNISPNPGTCQGYMQVHVLHYIESFLTVAIDTSEIILIGLTFYHE